MQFHTTWMSPSIWSRISHNWQGISQALEKPLRTLLLPGSDADITGEHSDNALSWIILSIWGRNGPPNTNYKIVQTNQKCRFWIMSRVWITLYLCTYLMCRYLHPHTVNDVYTMPLTFKLLVFSLSILSKAKSYNFCMDVNFPNLKLH